MAQRSSPKVSPSLRAMVCSTSTKWSDAETSCRMSTMASRWLRSRWSSATRSRSRATSSPCGGSSSVFGSAEVWSGCSVSILVGLVRVELIAVEADDFVAAGFLGDVQGVVRGSHEVVTLIDPRVWPSRHAKAGRAREGPTGKGECIPLDAFAHPLGEGGGVVQLGPGQEEHEFLAAVSPHTVDLARLVLEDVRK